MQQVGKIFGQIAFHQPELPVSRVQKGKFPCMQTLPLQVKFGFGWAIDLISHNGVPKACHMNADLMGTAGLQPAADVGITGIPGNDLIVCVTA